GETQRLDLQAGDVQRVAAQRLPHRRRGRVRAGRRQRGAPGREADQRQVDLLPVRTLGERRPGTRTGPEGIDGEAHTATLATRAAPGVPARSSDVWYPGHRRAPRGIRAGGPPRAW